MSPHPTPSRPAGSFQTTRWSLLKKVSEEDDENTALEHVCKAYWIPLFTYAKRRGMSEEDAEDAIQQFFQTLLQKNNLAKADPERGRFRTYLLTMLKAFLAKQYRSQNAAKRGGGLTPIAIDSEGWHEGHEEEISPGGPSDDLFDRAWATSTLEQTGYALEQEYAAAGKSALHRELQPLLVGDHADHPYAEIAARLEMSEGSVGVAVHRMRRRYGDLIREQVAATVSSPTDIDDEIRFLVRVLSSQK